MILDILGLSEVAELLGTTRGHVGVMRTRGKLPEPDAMLRCGPIWLRATIANWQGKVSMTDRTDRNQERARAVGN